MHKLYDTITLDEMNKDVLSGISRKLGGNTVNFVHSLWEHAFKALPEDMQDKDIIRYEGFSVVPIRERVIKYKDNVYSPGRKGAQGKVKHSIKQSDSVPVRFKFSILEGNERLEAYINMNVPYIRRNGICNLSGTTYYITPIISDIMLTPNDKGVFVKFDDIKFKINTTDINIQLLKPDGNSFVNIISGKILVSSQVNYRRPSKNNKGSYGSPKLPANLYILYKYGLKKTYGSSIEYIKHDKIKEYHEKGWFIYGVPNYKPKGHLLWVKSDYYIAVKKEPNSVEMGTISAVIHVLHHFPKSGVDLASVLDTKRESGFWEVSIGRMLYKDTKSDQFILRTVREDFRKFETFISGRLANKLEAIGFKPTTDYIDFLRELAIKIEDMKSSHLEYVNSFAFREIDIHYYFLYPFIEGVNKIIGEITKGWKTSGSLTRSKFHAMTTKKYSNDALMRKISKTPIALTLSKLEASSDNIFFKMTSVMLPQEIGEGVNRKTSSKANTEIIPKNMQGLHGSFPYIGNMLKLSKSVPVALASINPFLNITKNGNFIFTDEDIKVMTEIDKVLNSIGRNHIPDEFLADGEIIEE